MEGKGVMGLVNVSLHAKLFIHLFLKLCFRLALVVEGFMRLVEEDQLNGQVMRVTTEKGIDFQKFNPRYISRM